MAMSGVLTDAALKAGARGMVGKYGTQVVKNQIAYFIVGEGGYTTQNATETDAAGTGVAKTFTFNLAHVPVLRGSVIVTAGSVVAQDDGHGGLFGAGVVGTIKYKSGQVSLTYTVPVGLAVPIVSAYTYKSGAKTPNAGQLVLEAQGSPVDPFDIGHQAYFAKNFGSDASTFTESVDVPTPRALAHCFLDVFEFIDDGIGESPAIFEIGVFDTEDALLTYATMYPPVIKDGATQLSRTATFVW